MQIGLPLVAAFFGISIITMLIIAFARGSASRYHESGETVHKDNVYDFGVPAKSLYTNASIFSIRKQIDIMDDNNNIVYQSLSQFFSIHDYTELTKVGKGVVANISRKVFSFHDTHFIEMADGQSFTISRELMHVVRDVINIEELGWSLNGHMMHMNYYINDKNGDVVAAVGQKFLSINDRFSIDIYKPQYEDEIVAIFVVLAHMLQDDRNKSSSSSASTSN